MTQSEVTLNTIEIVTTNGKIIVIDVIDVDLLEFNWGAYKDYNVWYAKQQDAPYAPMHRIILERKIGRALTENELPDHRDCNGLNNQRENLRVASFAQNAQNARRRRVTRSGYKGVHPSKSKGKWEASIQANRIKHHLGTFDTPEEAYEAYCKAAKELHGEFANTSNPDGRWGENIK